MLNAYKMCSADTYLRPVIYLLIHVVIFSNAAYVNDVFVTFL